MITCDDPKAGAPGLDELAHRCFRCGYCLYDKDLQPNCPSHFRFQSEAYTPGARVWLSREVLSGRLDPSAAFGEILFSCTGCGRCAERCPFEFGPCIPDLIAEGKALALEHSVMPRPVRRYLENVYTHGNPYGLSSKKRTVLPVTSSPGAPLFHIGDAAGFDPHARQMAEAAAALFTAAGFPVCTLGRAERDSGADILRMGEEGLFDHIAEKLTAGLSAMACDRIICLSPHSAYGFKRMFPGPESGVSVRHVVEVLDDLVTAGRLKCTRPIPGRAVYHDPCYLGRTAGVYEAPRRLLDAIPGLTRMELAQSRSNGSCCGGGAGNDVTDLLRGPGDPAGRLLGAAMDAGATLVVTACPGCRIMLADARERIGEPSAPRVMDLTELIRDSALGEEP